MRIERMSHSKASTAELCGQLFVYRYIEDHEMPFGASGMRGRATHKANEDNYLALLDEGPGLAFDEVREIAASELTNEIDLKGVRHDGGYSEVAPENLRAVLLDDTVDLAGLYHQEIAPHVKPILIEGKIEIPPVADPEAGGWPFTWVSILDVVDDLFVIHDTKTKRKAPTKTLADDSAQLTGQELAFRAFYGKPSAGQVLDVIWKTPAKGILKHLSLETQRDVDDLAVFIKRIAVLHRALEAEIYLPAAQDHWICSDKWCDYTKICPYFRGKKRPTT